MPRVPIFLISTQGKSQEQMSAEAKLAWNKFVKTAKEARERKLAEERGERPAEDQGETNQ